MEDSKSVVLDILYSRIDASLSEQSNVKYLIKEIQSYADKHANVLLTPDMSERLIVTDNDKSIIFKAIGVDIKEVKAVIAVSPNIPPNWIKATNPFYVACMCIMHYFYKKAKENPKDTQSASYGDAVSVFLGYTLYTSSHKNSFKYLPNKEIMAYTVNNLNNRYLLKQVGTIQGCIEHTVIKAMHDRFMEEIVRGNDEDFNTVISSLDSRISSFIKNIADEFYKNHKAGAKIFSEEDNEDEENFHLSDNRSYKIDRVVQNTTSQIITKGFDQNNVLKRSVSMNPGVSEKKLDAMLRTIIADDVKNIPIVISSVLTLFMYKGSTNTIEDVKTIKFVSESLQIYKSNAQDEITYRIKDIMLSWIDLTAAKYGRNFISRGKTSLDSYRRALYTCFILQIFESAK